MYCREMDYENKFAERLAQLREQNGVSAREMSLSIGMSKSNINNIENRKNLPSMRVFFYICEFLNISPEEFFDFDNPEPELINEIMSDLKELSPKKLEIVAALIKELKN